MPKLRVEPEGDLVEVEAGQSVLEAALANEIELPFGCMAAKCGVCRIVVLEGTEAGLEEPSDLERLVLKGFESEPGVRLACQARIRGDVTVRSTFPRDD